MKYLKKFENNNNNDLRNMVSTDAPELDMSEVTDVVLPDKGLNKQKHFEEYYSSEFVLREMANKELADYVLIMKDGKHPVSTSETAYFKELLDLNVGKKFATWGPGNSIEVFYKTKNGDYFNHNISRYY